MARTRSTMTALGSTATDFTLPDTVSDQMISLSEARGDTATVIMFICNHCPFVVHVNEQLIKLAKDYQSKKISFIAISSNDIATHPNDAPDKMKSNAINLSYPFPYLYDASQEVAKSFGAVCTPDFFIYDNKLKLVYRGQLDDSRPGNGRPVNGKDIRDALDNLIAQKPVSKVQSPSIGCNIKWRATNEK